MATIKRFRALLRLTGLVAVLGPAAPVYAAPPSYGTVVEGKSVPGVALGATRAQATASWGRASYCQSTAPGNNGAGNNALCTFNTNAGSVNLYYSGPGGTTATGGPNDIVSQIDWIRFPHWRTTAGVTTASALAHPPSVMAAYPNGQVRRYGDGHLYSVTDNHLGITVYWFPVTYSSQFYVDIFIYPPTV
jgi:hypothetical protein